MPHHVRMRHIVDIYKRHKLTVRLSHAPNTGTRSSRVGLVDNPDPRIPARVVLAHGERLIARAVIDHNDLEVVVVLREDAVQALGYVPDRVVRGHHYRYGRHGNSSLAARRLPAPLLVAVVILRHGNLWLKFAKEIFC